MNDLLILRQVFGPLIFGRIYPLENLGLDCGATFKQPIWTRLEIYEYASPMFAIVTISFLLGNWNLQGKANNL